jgi:hypothetical protein
VTESILRSIDSPERQAEAFPRLTPGQIDRIRPYGRVRAVRPGEILFEAGDRLPLFVLLSEKLDIVWADPG